MAGIAGPLSGSECPGNTRTPQQQPLRGSCDRRLPKAGDGPGASVAIVESCLVITNEGAGTADQESLDRAVAVLSDRSSVEVVATSNPGELDGVLHRAGTRRIVVAGGDGSLHAVVAALHRRHDLADSVLGLIPLGTGNDFARCMDIPLDPEDAARLVLDGEVRPVDLLVDELGGIVVNNVHVGAGAQASRRGHRWKERLGSVGVGKRQPRQARLPDRRAAGGIPCRRSCGCGSRWTARWWSTWTSRC